VKTVQTINEPVAGVARLVGYLEVSHREVTALARLSSNAESFGVRTTAITKGPFGIGACLKLVGRKSNYELRVDTHTGASLGRVGEGKYTKLHACGTNTEACWAGILAVLERSEGRP
jgi:hypothetical protein